MVSVSFIYSDLVGSWKTVIFLNAKRVNRIRNNTGLRIRIPIRGLDPDSIGSVDPDPGGQK